MKRIYNKHFPTFHRTCKKVNCRPETLEEKKCRHRQGHGLTEAPVKQWQQTKILWTVQLRRLPPKDIKLLNTQKNQKLVLLALGENSGEGFFTIFFSIKLILKLTSYSTYIK